MISSAAVEQLNMWICLITHYIAIFLSWLLQAFSVQTLTPDPDYVLEDSAATQIPELLTKSQYNWIKSQYYWNLILLTFTVDALSLSLFLLEASPSQQ